MLDRAHADIPACRSRCPNIGAGAALTQHSDDPWAVPINSHGRPHPEEYQNWLPRAVVGAAERPRLPLGRVHLEHIRFLQRRPSGRRPDRTSTRRVWSATTDGPVRTPSISTGRTGIHSRRCIWWGAGTRSRVRRDRREGLQQRRPRPPAAQRRRPGRRRLHGRDLPVAVSASGGWKQHRDGDGRFRRRTPQRHGAMALHRRSHHRTDQGWRHHRLCRPRRPPLWLRRLFHRRRGQGRRSAGHAGQGARPGGVSRRAPLRQLSRGCVRLSHSRAERPLPHRRHLCGAFRRRRGRTRLRRDRKRDDCARPLGCLRRGRRPVEGVERTFETSATGGEIDLEFHPIHGEAIVSALSITPATPKPRRSQGPN